MKEANHDSNRKGSATTGRLADAAHLQAIEGNPLSPDELAMFEMFEREGWSPEKRRAHIARRLKVRGRVALYATTTHGWPDQVRP